MPSLPAALAVAAALVAIAAAAVTTAPTAGPFAGPNAGPATWAGFGGSGLRNGTVTAQAGPRPAVTVPPTGPGDGSPPGPSRGPTTEITAPGTGEFGLPLAGAPHVLRGFAPGPHPWSPGHRGVDLGSAGPRAAALAAGAGTVSFAGMIAGRPVIAIRHPSGLRTTYEPVTPGVVVGQAVTRGQRIGALATVPGHCAGGPCLHWGALVGERYLDPLSLLDGHARRPPVLLPVTGTAP